MEEKIVICADVIAKYRGKIVLVQRFTNPPGFALPGGKLDDGEFLTETAKREFLEETGMTLEIEAVLSTFAKKDRDPRGQYISTVFIGRASGTPKDESGKTKVIFETIDGLPGIKDRFIFDHWEILEKYFDLSKKEVAMANKVRPIKPGEVAKKKEHDFPDAVFEAFNEMIAENYSERAATFKQEDVVALMVKKGLTRGDIFKKGWLDIEDVYDKAGWEVDYDRPGYNESYATTFTFRDRRTHR